MQRRDFDISGGNQCRAVFSAMPVTRLLDPAVSFLLEALGFDSRLTCIRFVLSDALWNMSMAMNVYLTVFKNYNTDDLKRLEWIYLLVNYGLPFIPAFAYCFINIAGKGKIYGPAVLWCWVIPEFDFLRVALLYGPAWYASFPSFVCK